VAHGGRRSKGAGNGHQNGNGTEHHHGNGTQTATPTEGETTGPVLQWETDLAGCIKRIEGDVLSVYGRTADQLLGQPFTFLTDEVQGHADLEHLSLLLAGHPCAGYRTCHQHADGSAVELYIVGERLRDANDRVVGARGTARPTGVPATA